MLSNAVLHEVYNGKRQTLQNIYINDQREKL